MNARYTTTTLASLVALAAALASTGCSAPADGGEADQAAGAQALATPASLPSGNYRGTGDFAGAPGESGEYRAEYAISANALAMHDSWGPDRSPSEESVQLSLTWQNDHEFTFTTGANVKDDGAASGYCVDDRCHFSAVSGGQVWFEMSLVFGPSSLAVVGSKVVDGGSRVYWSETLQKL
jgi:hypothetical protein